jgi:hypothetical protein
MADISKYLILFNGKDRTADIESFEREGRYIKLKFPGNPRVYTCGADKAAVYSDPEELPADEYAFISKGYRFANLTRVQKFTEHWRIFLQNGKSHCLYKEEVEVVHSCLGSAKNKTLFDYLKALAFHDSLKIDGGASFLGKQYTATGDIALSTYRFTFVTLFNKDEFDNSSVPYLYEAVSNEEWTLDYQASLAKNFYRDINGSGKKDEGDFFGLITCPGICTDPYWASCDLSVVEKDADGYYEYVVDIAQLSDVMDKILNLYYDCGGTNLYLPEADNVEQDKIRNLFAKGECAMTTLRLVAVEQGDVRNMAQQYGIVPIPKYSTDQKGYRSQMHDQFTVFAIPSSAAQNRLEMLGATLEVMASESARTVKPAYYEIAVKRKYMSDPVAWEMLDLIFANVKVDPGLIYTNSLEKPLQTLRDISVSKQNTVSSSYEKMRSKAKKSLAKLNSKLEDLE